MLLLILTALAFVGTGVSGIWNFRGEPRQKRRFVISSIVLMVIACGSPIANFTAQRRSGVAQSRQHEEDLRRISGLEGQVQRSESVLLDSQNTIRGARSAGKGDGPALNIARRRRRAVRIAG